MLRMINRGLMAVVAILCLTGLPFVAGAVGAFAGADFVTVEKIAVGKAAAPEKLAMAGFGEQSPLWPDLDCKHGGAGCISIVMSIDDTSAEPNVVLAGSIWCVGSPQSRSCRALIRRSAAWNTRHAEGVVLAREPWGSGLGSGAPSTA